MNATALYVSACRSVLQCDPRDPEALTEIFKLLPFFRQSLGCLVCGESVLCYYMFVSSHCVLACVVVLDRCTRTASRDRPADRDTPPLSLHIANTEAEAFILITKMFY